VHNDLPERIRLYRASKGESQEELAQRIGSTRGTVSNWERGSLPEPFATLIQEIERAEKAAEDGPPQLSLPFDEPIGLEVRISPKEPGSIRVDVEWKQKTG